MYQYTPGNVCLKIISMPSSAKCIKILRKYNNVSISNLLNSIKNNDYILCYPYISHSGIRKIRNCYDELVNSGIEVEIYEHNRLTSREFLSNLIESHNITDLEIQSAIEHEITND